MECILWVHRLMYILRVSYSPCIQYSIIIDPLNRMFHCTGLWYFIGWYWSTYCDKLNVITLEITYYIVYQIISRYHSALYWCTHNTGFGGFTWLLCPYASGSLHWPRGNRILTQCQGSNPGGYGLNQLVHNHNKHNKARTVCIILLLYMYCMRP